MPSLEYHKGNKQIAVGMLACYLIFCGIQGIAFTYCHIYHDNESLRSVTTYLSNNLDYVSQITGFRDLLNRARHQ
jgi:hypothetical protein